MKSNEQLYRELWTWCSETGLDKKYWYGLKEYQILFDNPACAEEAERSDGIDSSSCEMCPIKHFTENGAMFYQCNEITEYGLWREAVNNENIEEAKKWAKIMSEKEWNKC